MSALDTDIAFSMMMARVARAHSTRAASFELPPDASKQNSQLIGSGRIHAICIVAALAVLSVVTIFAGCFALTTPDPTIWIHRLIAVSLAQSILFAAMVMKVVPLATAGRQSVKMLVAEPPAMLEQKIAQSLGEKIERDAAAPPPLPRPAPQIPSRPILVGHGLLAGRDYAEYSDGSVEIDTMLGRRRFVSLATARTFVGA